MEVYTVLHSCNNACMCLLYLIQSINSEGKIDDVIREITDFINSRCQCNIYFTDSHFHCFSTLSSYVTFFSTIDGTPRVPTAQLIIYLESWVAPGPTLTIQSKSLRIDRDCSLVVSSFFEECRGPIGSGGNNNLFVSAVIAALVVAVVIFALSIMLGLIIRLLIVRRRNKFRKKITPPKFTEYVNSILM